MNSSRSRRPRSDASRNREAILQAALRTLNESPGACMGEIAVAAGVSRGTLYSHFASRQALVGAALRRVASEVNTTLTALDPALSPEDSVVALAATSWRALGDLSGALTAAGGELSPREVSRLHQEPTDRLREVVMRGRRDGSFRTDQSVNWQVECIYAIVRAGSSLAGPEKRGDADPAAPIAATLQAALAAQPAASESVTLGLLPR